MAGFAEALRPEKFSGEHFKRWQTKVTLWLTSMNVFWAVSGRPMGPLSPEEESRYEAANTVCVGGILGVLADKVCDAHIHITNAKELWDVLEAKYGASDAGSELYQMEQFHDYKMVDNRSVVEQAHEVQNIVRELGLLNYALPDKFVAGCIIAKLPSTWRNFATTLKHKRQEISVESLIASLDVEEKARAKDAHGKGGEGTSAANTVRQGNPGQGKKGKNKVNQTTNFKKKKKNSENKGACFVCGGTDHWAKKCKNRFGGKKAGQGQSSNAVNTVTIGNTYSRSRGL